MGRLGKEKLILQTACPQTVFQTLFFFNTNERGVKHSPGHTYPESFFLRSSGRREARRGPKKKEGVPRAPSEIEKTTMTSCKLVIKCGDYAVLADLNLMPQESSEHSVWLSDRKREEICMLLKDAVDSRVKHYLRARKRHGQGKQMEDATANPLFMQGDDFHISAYFVKRWVNLRCVGRQQDSDLRVFPERFVICVTKFESSPPPWEENLPPGTSTYFGRSAEERKWEASLTQQEKQDVLKKIVKRTTIKKSNTIKAQPSKDTMDVYLGLLSSDSE